MVKVRCRARCEFDLAAALKMNATLWRINAKEMTVEDFGGSPRPAQRAWLAMTRVQSCRSTELYTRSRQRAGIPLPSRPVGLR